jgi:hypothetical protein
MMVLLPLLSHASYYGGCSHDDRLGQRGSKWLNSSHEGHSGEQNNVQQMVGGLPSYDDDLHTKMTTTLFCLKSKYDKKMRVFEHEVC